MSRRQRRNTSRSGGDLKGNESGEGSRGKQSGPWMYGLVGALAMAVAVSVFWRIAGDGPGVSQASAADGGRGQTGRIVVVDSKAALQAYMDELEQQVLSGIDMTEAQLQMRGAEFGAEFVRAVNRYRERGYIVMDRNQVLTAPPELDITQEIAEILGLEIRAADDPFAAPVVR